PAGLPRRVRGCPWRRGGRPAGRGKIARPSDAPVSPARYLDARHGRGRRVVVICLRAVRAVSSQAHRPSSPLLPRRSPRALIPHTMSLSLPRLLAGALAAALIVLAGCDAVAPVTENAAGAPAASAVARPDASADVIPGQYVVVVS